MKGLKTLMAIGLVAALSASVVPASAKAPAKGPAKTPAYKHYVACGLSQNAKPSGTCQAERDKGAFFRSNKRDVFYTVCVKFPTKKNLCAPKQEAVKGTLYVNKITSNIPGNHQVSWFVKGKRVGVTDFLVPEPTGKRQHGK